MNDKTIVLVTGKAQSGKDTSCDYMIDKFNEKYMEKFLYSDMPPQSVLTNQTRYTKYSFAYALKCFCRDVFNVEEHKLFGTDQQKNEFTHIRWKDLPFAIFITSGIKV